MWTFTWKSLIYFDLIMFVRWKNEIIQYLGQSRPHKFKLRPLEDILRHLKDVQTPRLNIMEHLEAKRGQILDYNSLLGPKDNWSCCAESVGCINRNLFSLIILCLILTLTAPFVCTVCTFCPCLCMFSESLRMRTIQPSLLLPCLLSASLDCCTEVWGSYN